MKVADLIADLESGDRTMEHLAKTSIDEPIVGQGLADIAAGLLNGFHGHSNLGLSAVGKSAFANQQFQNQQFSNFARQGQLSGGPIEWQQNRRNPLL